MWGPASGGASAWCLQSAVERGALRRGVEDRRRLVGRERPVPDAHLRNVTVEVVLDGRPPKLGADRHRRHLVGELGARLGGGGDAAVDEQSHRRAVVRRHHLVPLARRHRARRHELPRLDLPMEEGAQLLVDAEAVLAGSPSGTDSSTPPPAPRRPPPPPPDPPPDPPDPPGCAQLHREREGAVPPKESGSRRR